MTVFPPTIEAKLGFDVIRERLQGYVLSRMGEERLEAARPAHALERVREELERVGEMQEALRFDDAVPLDHVLDVREIIRRVLPEEAFVSPEDLLAVQLVLATMRRLHSYFESRSQKYTLLAVVAGRLSPLPAIERRIEAVVDEQGRVKDDASAELSRLRRLIQRRQAQLREVLMRELRNAIGQGWATEEQPTIRNSRMVIPVRAESKRKVQGFVHDTSATGQTVYIEPAACLDLNNDLRTLEAEERREVERILRDVAQDLRAHVPEIRDNLDVLGTFDYLHARARLANDLDARVPQLNDEGFIRIRKGRNAVLQLHFKRRREQDGEDRSVVPLELALGREYHSLVITGPNAGGKSVAMKTIGLFSLMLAYGIPIPADPLSDFSVFERLFVDIGDEQSIEEDLSTFSSHLANLRYMLSHADERTLILIDEAGTGTDPAEGGALAQAVLEHLTGAGARTIVTTHHGTLKVFAHETEGIENGSMQFDQDTLSPTYRFQPGVPGSSYAFEIAARLQLPDALLERARTLVGRQKTALEELISTFEARNQALQEKLEQAEQTLKESTEARQQYQEQARRIKADKQKIRDDALREAERLLKEANARVERTIREIREAQAEKEATRAARESLDSMKQVIQQRRRKSERRQAPARERAHRQEPVREIRVGDQVVLNEGTTIAEVLEIDGPEAVIAFGSMRLRARLDKLSKVGGPKAQQVTFKQVASDQGLPAMRVSPVLDVRGQRVDEAMQQVVHFLDETVAANLQQVDIIHGKGTGALRQAVHDFLREHPDVSGFDEAPLMQGGAGVTRVNLR